MSNRRTKLVLLLSAALVAVVAAGIYWETRPPNPTSAPPAPAPTAKRPLRKRPPLDRTPKPRRPVERPAATSSGRPSGEAKEGLIEGYVLDVGRAAVKGATVVLARSATTRPTVTLSGSEKGRRAAVARLFQYYPDHAKSLHPLSMDLPPAPEVAPIATTVSDAHGAFRFKGGFAPGLVVSATKGRTVAVPRDAVPGQKCVLVLLPGATLAGSVESAIDGRMLSHAKIRVRSSRVDTSVESDSNGRFSLPALPPGAIRIMASAKGFATTVLTGITLSAGDDRRLRIEMTKGYRVTATVLGSKEDADDVPLSGATVGIVRPGDDAYAIGKTDKEGKVVFSGLSPGKYLGNAAAKGRLASGPEVIEVKDRDATHEFDLDPAVKSKIVVYDERGVAVAGAVLYTANPDADFDRRLSRKVGVTDEAGRFEFPFDWDGSNSVLFVAAKGYAMSSVSPDDPSAGSTLKVVLHEGCTIRGRVTDTAGSPIQKALVTIDVIASRNDQPDITATVLTNDEGEYEFDFLPLGDVDVDAQAPGYADAEVQFDVRAPNEPQVRNLKLEKQ